MVRELDFGTGIGASISSGGVRKAVRKWGVSTSGPAGKTPTGQLPGRRRYVALLCVWLYLEDAERVAFGVDELSRVGIVGLDFELDVTFIRGEILLAERRHCNRSRGDGGGFGTQDRRTERS